MSDQTLAPTNGAVFAIGGLLSMIVPFEFEFEGSKLTGRWYKYKTSTRAYATQKANEKIALLDQWGKLQIEIQSLQTNDPRTDELTKQCEQLQGAIERSTSSWLVDALVEWNAVGLDGKTIIPITPEGFVDIPIPFLEMLAEHLKASRTDKNPTSTDSQSG